MEAADAPSYLTDLCSVAKRRQPVQPPPPDSWEGWRWGSGSFQSIFPAVGSGEAPVARSRCPQSAGSKVTDGGCHAGSEGQTNWPPPPPGADFAEIQDLAHVVGTSAAISGIKHHAHALKTLSKLHSQLSPIFPNLLAALDCGRRKCWC